MKVEGLREILANGGDALAGLAANIEMIRTLQNSEGLTLMDSKDEFEVHAYAFAGLDKVLEQFGGQVAGALQVPKTRLFGESPGGLNSDGDSGFRTYYDGIKQQQVQHLGPGVEKVYALAWTNKFGSPPPEEFDLDFKDLWQLSDVETANVVNTKTAAIVAAYKEQIISRSTALKELKALGKSTGVFTNISDEEIAEALNDPAPTAEALGLALPKPAPNAGPAKKGKGSPANKKG
jgi:hypothetical protein